MQRKSSLFMAIGACLLAASPALAVDVTWSTSGDWEPTVVAGTPGTIYADPNSGTANLTVGVPFLIALNPVTTDIIPLTEASTTDTLSQTVTIAGGGPAKSLSQSITINTSAPDFFAPSQISATIAPATPLVFDLGATGVLTVTPQGGQLFPTTDEDTVFYNFAELVLSTPVPEPGSGMLLLAGAALLTARRRRA